MDHIAFREYFPEIADKETREFFVSKSNTIPTGRYALIELYCTDENCDCRRVIIHVVSQEVSSIVGTISYGWESRQFYEKWMGLEEEDFLKELGWETSIDEAKGPCLNTAGPQSLYAKEVLKIVSEILQDDDYVDMLKRHYKMFKNKILKFDKSIGRNEFCPCGSDKKYKKCCG